MQKIHIGQQIKNHLKESGQSVTWLARQLNCERTKIYRLFRTPYIDTDILFTVSKILKYDFFVQYSRRLSETLSASFFAHIFTKLTTKVCVFSNSIFLLGNEELAIFAI
ncbi:MAG: hypothetical protein LBU90_05655 [Bacteroidales bacterium]|jgi:hypothetical protein|nr:hypothetical protein [Bacteroidales bacterium]